MFITLNLEMVNLCLLVEFIHAFYPDAVFYGIRSLGRFVVFPFLLVNRSYIVFHGGLANGRCYNRAVLGLNYTS